MQPIVLSDIPFEVDLAALRKRLHMDDESPLMTEVGRLAAEAQAVAHPRAIYGVAFIDDQGEDYVVVDGVRLTSRVLRVNLDQVHRVFPYVATCGMELQEWADAFDDPLLSYAAEALKEMALRAATKALHEHMHSRFALGKTAVMNPGSLPDWPLKQQRPLFALIGDVTAQVGVRLTETLLMIPTKSVSGIRFSNAEGYENCQLCPRLSCPGRRAPYDAALYERKYQPLAQGTH